MKRTHVELMPEKVLNTLKENGSPEEEAVDVSVLISDYAKIRAIARKTRTTTMETLRSTLCAGVRRLVAESAVFAVAIAFVLAAAPADAGLFSSDGDDARPAVRERLVGLFGAAKAADYKAGAAARENLAADCAALARMVKDKEDRYAGICADLERVYGMTLSQNYNYSKEELTLYLVVTNGLFGSSPENPVMRAHRAFISEEDAQGFVGMVASRTAAAEDAAILRRLLAERRRDLAAADDSMRDRFGVVAGKEYRLDEKSGKLFELQPMPTEEELKAQREAEARAVADAKASAEARRKAEREAKAAREKAAREAELKARREREAAEAKAKAEREAKAKAEKEARARAEAEREAREKEAKARAKAEREAREKAEREEKARLAAEKEAARKAAKEAEAKAAAEKEAARKAAKEAEAKAKAEKKAEEAREKAAREAMKKAENARREAERNARREFGW